MLRDDLDLDKEYSLSANHDDEHGGALRKKIWKVTAILTAITIVEVVTGGSIKQYYDGVPNESWWMIKWGFIVLTLIKAGYIVLSFMHLGDERKNFRYMVLGPYMLFIAYLIFNLLAEASYWGEIIHE
jgi:cytochrome c oxidase subunit IV